MSFFPLYSLPLNKQQRRHASAEEIGNVKHARLEKKSEGLQTSSIVSTMGKRHALRHKPIHTKLTHVHMHAHTHTHNRKTHSDFEPPAAFLSQ